MKFVLLMLLLAGPVLALEDSRPQLDTSEGASIPGVSLSLRRSVSGAYELVVRNNAAFTIWYSGYGPEGGSPYYSLEIFRDGKWVEHLLGWCGVGLGDSRLGVKKEIRLDPAPEILFPISPGEKFRISILFSTERYREGKSRPSVRVYSNEIAYIPAEEKRANQPPEPMPLKRHGSS